MGLAGLLITGNDDVKLRSSNGLVTVAVPAGSVSSPITLNYHEAGVSDRPEMPQGFTGAGVYFRLSVTSSDAGGDSVDLQRMLSITITIGPDELALAEADYSRFVIHHYMSRFQNWETLPTQADPVASQVTVQIGGLSLFALTVGPPSASATARPRNAREQVSRRTVARFPEQDLCILSRGGKMARLAITCNSHRRAKPTIEEKRRGVNQS